MKIDNDSDNGLKGPENSLPILLDPSLAPFTTGVDISVDGKLKTDSWSLFGQAEWDLTDRLTLLTGLRLIQEKKDYDMAQGLYPSASSYKIHQGDRITLNSYTDDTSDTIWTGKLQLDYHPNDNLLLYAGVNRGVKAGSFNAPLAGTFFSLPNGNGDIPYGEEVLINYEAGFKSTLFGGTTRLNGSIYYYDYKDYQSFLFVGVGGVVINNDAVNQGIEVELQTTPLEGLDLLFGLALFDAEVKNVPLRLGSTITRDVQPTYAPELQVTALARYEWLGLGGTLAVQGDLSYSDKFYYNLRNFDADKFDSYILANARLSWRNAQDTWELAFLVRNLTDERVGVQGFDLATLCGCNEVAYRAPRWYGIKVNRRF